MLSLRLLATIACCGLALGCSAVVENRVADGLAEAGLSRGMAECMAQIWSERLSVAQIRRISALAADVGAQGGDLTVLGLVDRVRRMNDPEAVEVVASSAARCALR